MGWFGSADLATKIILFGLSISVLTAGLIRVCIEKRRQQKHEATLIRKLARSMIQEHESVDIPQEGDLFGVRALEAGFFGGVTQSQPSSPAISATTFASSTDLSILDGSDLRESRNSLATTRSLPEPNASNLRLPARANLSTPFEFRPRSPFLHSAGVSSVSRAKSPLSLALTVANDEPPPIPPKVTLKLPGIVERPLQPLVRTVPISQATRVSGGSSKFRAAGRLIMPEPVASPMDRDNQATSQGTPTRQKSALANTIAYDKNQSVETLSSRSFQRGHVVSEGQEPLIGGDHTKLNFRRASPDSSYSQKKASVLTYESRYSKSSEISESGECLVRKESPNKEPRAKARISAVENWEYPLENINALENYENDLELNPFEESKGHLFQISQPSIDDLRNVTYAQTRGEISNEAAVRNVVEFEGDRGRRPVRSVRVRVPSHLFSSPESPGIIVIEPLRYSKVERETKNPTAPSSTETTIELPASEADRSPQLVVAMRSQRSRSSPASAPITV